MVVLRQCLLIVEYVIAVVVVATCPKKDEQSKLHRP